MVLFALLILNKNERKNLYLHFDVAWVEETGSLNHVVVC